DVARLGLAHDEAVALGAVEPFHPRLLQRSVRGRRRPAGAGRREVPGALAAQALVAGTTHRRGRGLALVDVEDGGDLPALLAAHHVAGDRRPFGRGLAAAVAEAGDVQQHILQAGLSRVVRDDEAIAL